MILAILQARMSSNRLPGKVLMPILGVPMVLHQLRRIQDSKMISELILATSNDPSDDELANYFMETNQSVFRGDLNDVLARYYHCAARYQPEHVVRVTGDCPLSDPKIIDQVIQCHLDEGNDYTGAKDFPDGYDVEVFRFKALEEAHLMAQKKSEREHVTCYINQRPENYQLGVFQCNENLSEIRLSVDYLEDFLVITKIFESLYPKKLNFDFNDVMDYLNKNPEIKELNKHIVNNEGLALSLLND